MTEANCRSCGRPVMSVCRPDPCEARKAGARNVKTMLRDAYAARGDRDALADQRAGVIR